MAENGTGGVLLLALGAAAYFTRASWMPALGITAPGATGATGANPAAPTVTTSSQPIGPNTPGAQPLGNQGCYQYANGTDSSVIINCPPGVSPPMTSQVNNCKSGFTLDAAGICTRYPDAVLLAELNTLPWTGLADIPAEQIARIDPSVLAMYSTTTGVNAGTVLAYMLGLGANPADGTIANGSDGNAYQALAGVFYRQGTSSGSTVNGVRIGRIGSIAAALPITNGTLIEASCDPAIAALVGRDQRAMLTAGQWNAYYTQCTGIVQGISLHPAEDPFALMSAEQYQARRAAAGLRTGKMGSIRNARKGAFPLGGLGLINQWVPPGNRNVFRIPGRGAVVQTNRVRRIGLIQDGGGNHRWARSPFPRPSWWRTAE